MKNLFIRTLCHKTTVQTVFFLSALGIGLIALISIVHIVRIDQPLNSWEASIIVDAARVAEGLPLYEDYETGHAATMYTPLLVYISGLIFKITGPLNYIPKLINVISALGLCLLISTTLFRKDSWVWKTAGFCFLLGIHLRSGGYYAVGRPDLLALGLALPGMLLSTKGLSRQQSASLILGSLLLLAAFWAKQTAITFTAFPLVYCLIHKGTIPLKQLLLGLLPLALCVISMILMKYISPWMYFYTVVLGSYYSISPTNVIALPLGLIISMPAVVAAIPFVGQHAKLFMKDPIGAGVLSSAIITLPTCAVFTAKTGGAMNSLLPAQLSLMALALYSLRFLPRWPAPRFGDILRQGLLLFFLPSLFVLSVLSLKGTFYSLEYGFNDIRNPVNTAGWWPKDAGEHYKDVIQFIRSAEGAVTSPMDPTLMLYARHEFIRGMKAELDVEVGDRSSSNRFNQDYATATWVVEVMPESMGYLGYSGFSLFKEIGPYHIYRRKP